MGPAKAVVVEQFADRGVPGDQPGLIADRGAHPMDRTGGPDRTQFVAGAQGMRLRKRQVSGQDRSQA